MVDPTSDRPIGILGGTFDPVHNGHLRLALELAQHLQLAQVRVVPCAKPPHRDRPGAGPGQRAKWVRMATNSEPLLTLDDRELLRDGASYTVDTLQSMRGDWPDRSLCLIMGRDVFADLASWHAWDRLLDYAHIILIERPDCDIELAEPVAALLEQHQTNDTGAIANRPAGAILPVAPPALSVSGSRIRELLAAGHSPRYLLPEAVLEDIIDNAVYDPSTQPK